MDYGDRTRSRGEIDSVVLQCVGELAEQDTASPATTIGVRLYEPHFCYTSDHGYLMSANSSEANVNRLKQILTLEGPDFLGQAYLLMLGRPVDPEGFRNYEAQLRAGTSKLSILAELRSSQEGRAYGANAPDPTVLLGQVPLSAVSPGRSLQELLLLNGSAFVDEGFVSAIGRLPHDADRRRYVARLNGGADKLQILLEMLEANGGATATSVSQNLLAAIKKMRGGLYPLASSIDELLGLDDVAFIDCAYKTLLGRSPDAAGVVHYLQLIRSGAAKMRIVSGLCLSEEGRKRKSRLRGVKRAILRYGLARSRLVGWLYRPIAQVEGETPVERRLRAIENTLVRMAQDRERECIDGETAVDDVTRLLKTLSAHRPL